MSATKSASILLPNGEVPLVVAPGVEGYAAILVRPGERRPFKVTSAESVEGIDYSAFACPGMFLGSLSFPAPPERPWPLSMMFRDFRWPGGGSNEWGTVIPYIGEVDFYFRLVNRSDVPQRFAIKLVGQELAA